jgi:formyltetrahydrofolate deformylase
MHKILNLPQVHDYLCSRQALLSGDSTTVSIPMATTKNSAILLLSCPDRVGLVSRISHFVFERGGNIIDLDEHVDMDTGTFFIRVAWDMNDFSIAADDLPGALAPLAKEFNARWSVNFTQKEMRVALFVSKYDHCLQELLWRQQLGEYPVVFPLIISNHPDLADLARQYEIPYHVIPITRETKAEQEQKELALLKEHEIDSIVLARYMQVLTPEFVAEYPNRIINIHHSFLPSFMGGNPYQQAYERGVKIIGATSHYVTGDLDQGPIIDQDVIRISHKDTVADLKRKGRDLERLVLARALKYHAEYRILPHGKKTIIFD